MYFQSHFYTFILLAYFSFHCGIFFSYFEFTTDFLLSHLPSICHLLLPALSLSSLYIYIYILRNFSENLNIKIHLSICFPFYFFFGGIFFMLLVHFIFAKWNAIKQIKSWIQYHKRDSLKEQNEKKNEKNTKIQIWKRKKSFHIRTSHKIL